MVCVDVGQNQIFTCKYLPQKHGRLLTSGGLGTMGYALPAAMGAKVAAPERQTVVCGDGSFQMAMNELSAIRVPDMDVKIVLFRNQVLGLVHQIQNTAPYHGPFGVALDGSPDFAAIAGRLRHPQHVRGRRGQAGRGAGPVPEHQGLLPADLRGPPRRGHQRLKEERP
ncbi:MAG: thiamine pyrophosphate-dependent enzyme [Lawsonibacter sp.]